MFAFYRMAAICSKIHQRLGALQPALAATARLPTCGGLPTATNQLKGRTAENGQLSECFQTKIRPS